MCIRDRYCWYVRTTGAYSDPAIVAPLINFSQIACARPVDPVSYTHLRAHETVLDLVCRLLLEKKKKQLTI